MAVVEVFNLDEVIRAFGVLPEHVGASVRDELAPVVRDMQGRLAIYPAERPNQRYRRTGHLGRGWTEATPQYVIRAGGGIDLRVTNPVSYVDQVQGDDQALVFRGRWETIASVVTAFEDDILIAVERGTSLALQRLG